MISIPPDTSHPFGGRPHLGELDPKFSAKIVFLGKVALFVLSS